MPAGLSILVVEDESMVAMDLQDCLQDLGHRVDGVAMRLEEACRLARLGAFDAAFLDLNLAGQRCEPVAEILRGRGIPFAFTTGYGEAAIGERYRSVPLIEKPYTQADIERALLTLRFATDRRLDGKNA